MAHAFPARNPRQHVRLLVNTVRREQHQHRLPDSLGRRVAEDALRAGIPARDDPVECLADDGVVGGRHDRRQSRLRRLRLMTFHAQLRLRERPFHGACQPRRPVFEQVIRGAIAHRLHGHIFAHRAGNQDEGDVPPACPQQFQGPQPAEVRHRIVGQNDLRRVLQCGQKVRLGLHARPLGIKTGAAQLAHQQVRVIRVVLDNQQSQPGHDLSAISAPG